LLASSIILSRTTNEPLSVIWLPSEGCGAELGDVFDLAKLSDADMFNLLDSDAAVALLSETHHLITANVSATTLFEHNSTLAVLRHVGMVFPVSNVNGGETTTTTTIVKANGQFMPSSMPCADYYAAKSEIYKVLRSCLLLSLSETASSTVSSIRPTNGGRIVGVHYREYDSHHDWAVVPPQSSLLNSAGAIPSQVAGGGSNSGTEAAPEAAEQWPQVSPLSSFLANMRALLARDPGLNFFVASNSAAAKSALVDAFPADVVYTLSYNRAGSSDLISRSEVSSIQLAAIDFFVLAASDFIVHSFGSSFGEEAAVVNLLPSVRIREGGDIYGVDTNLPSCNNNQLISLRILEEAAAEKVCYEDGTGRRICQPKLQKNLCSSVMAEWGLGNVYC
jgi:hypothetical protein